MHDSHAPRISSEGDAGRAACQPQAGPEIGVIICSNLAALMLGCSAWVNRCSPSDCLKPFQDTEICFLFPLNIYLLQTVSL